MLRLMALFKALRGTDLTPDEEQAIKSLEAHLPDGWRFKELRHQLIGRRPVKHRGGGQGTRPHTVSDLWVPQT